MDPEGGVVAMIWYGLYNIILIWLFEVMMMMMVMVGGWRRPAFLTILCLCDCIISRKYHMV